MRRNKTYAAPVIKVRAIEAEDALMEVSGGKKGNLLVSDEELDTEEIGAKAGNTSDGWDDWEED